MNAIFDRPYVIACLRAEAENQSDECQRAIVASIRNRVRSGRYEPTMAGVVMQRYQYSETLPDKVNNANYERVLNSPASPETARAAANYDAVMADPNIDPSNGACHFFSDPAKPIWATAPAYESALIGTVHFWSAVA